MTRYRVKLFVAEGVIAADQFAKPLSRALVSDPLDAHRANVSTRPLSGTRGPPVSVCGIEVTDPTGRVYCFGGHARS